MPIRHHFARTALGLAAICLCTPSFAYSYANEYEKAVDALSANRHQEFRKIVAKMGDHPIAGYTQYQYLSGRLKTEKVSVLRAFIDEYGYLKVSDSVRKELLGRAYKNNNWQDILSYYDSDGAGTTEQCEYLVARIRQQESNADDKALLERIWKRGKSQPDACDDAFAAAKGSVITRALVWKRVENAVRERNYDFALYLGKKWLDGTDVSPVVRARKEPINYIRGKIINPASDRGRLALTLALEYLSVDEPERAVKNFNAIRKKYGLKNADNPYLLTRLCHRLSINHHAESLEICDRVDNDYVASFNTESEWRVRAAIRQGDWQRLLDYWHGLPADAQQEVNWKYWRARALIGIGAEREGVDIFESISKDRSLAGFLACDYLQRPYNFSSHPISERLSQLGHNTSDTNAALDIVKSLVEIDQPLAAKEQLAYSVPRVNEISQLLMAEYALSKEWYLQAVLATSRAQYYDDLNIRFPLPHADNIRKFAKMRGVDDYWIAALIRQESIFTADIRSSAGAIGLMQIMPRTARSIAKDINMRAPKPSKLINPELNIRLGSWYIADLWSTFSDRPRAIAAYNAGPNRSSSWTNSNRKLEVDQWIETIPFNETRNYVRRVLAYSAIYAHKLGRSDFNMQAFARPLAKSKIAAIDISIDSQIAAYADDSPTEKPPKSIIPGKTDTTRSPEDNPPASAPSTASAITQSVPKPITRKLVKPFGEPFKNEKTKKKPPPSNLIPY